MEQWLQYVKHIAGDKARMSNMRSVETIIIRQQFFLSMEPADAAWLKEKFHAMVATLTSIRLARPQELKNEKKWEWDKIINKYADIWSFSY